MSESYSLPSEPEGMVATLLERFNSGKVQRDDGLVCSGSRAHRERRANHH